MSLHCDEGLVVRFSAIFLLDFSTAPNVAQIQDNTSIFVCQKDLEKYDKHGTNSPPNNCPQDKPKSTIEELKRTHYLTLYAPVHNQSPEIKNLRIYTVILPVIKSHERISPE